MKKVLKSDVLMGKVAQLNIKYPDDDDLKLVLKEIHKGRLYYEYYHRYINNTSYQKSIKQFNKLANDPRATSAQLKAALGLASADIEQLFMQTHYWQERFDHEYITSNEEIMNYIYEGNYLIKFFSILNFLAMLVIGAKVFFF